MRKTLILSLLFLSGAAMAAPAVPTDLNGRKIQFSYPTSWKFTPLIIHFGEAAPDRPGTYALHGEGRCCEVSYAPDAAGGKARLSVSGKGDKASINLNFITDTCGTAHMKWNGTDYHNLAFRLEDDADRRAYLCRMGDPVGDVVPPTLAGKVVEIDFSGAFGGQFNQETHKIDYRAWSSAPWVVKFPLSGQGATAQLPGVQNAVSACYEPMGCGAMISLQGKGIHGAVTLDFATSGYGMARVEWEADGADRVVCAAGFRIRPANLTGTAPADMSGKLLVVDFTGAQQADAERGEPPTKWVPCLARPLILQFPTGCDNSYRYQLYESTPESPWPPVTVTYRPEDSKITIAENDLSLEVTLSFKSDTEGTATVAWHDEILSGYMRGAIFTISDSRSTTGLVSLPESEAQDSAVQCVDDGLGELVRELEQTKYDSAVERLYQKRLLILLQQIMEGGHIDNTIANANGTTALHNACGLSHVEIVQWLVDHGADLDAQTAKGANVDDCVGGPNAKAIRAILRKTRNSK